MRGRLKDLRNPSVPPLVTAVLNVTPDSYFAPSRTGEHDLLKKAEACIDGGADAIEIGGESTGPGSADVPLEEELRRVVPAVASVRARFPETLIVVDTWKSAVARAALDAGADVLNDVTAGRADPDYLAIAASANAPVILMYAKDGTPRTTVAKTEYEDVVAAVGAFLGDRIAAATKAGIDPNAIIIDPGLGHFVSADSAYSYELLFRLRELAALAPVLVSPSRKSFLAGVPERPPSERLPATIAASGLAVMNGARWIRTHDAKAISQALADLEPLRCLQTKMVATMITSE